MLRDFYFILNLCCILSLQEVDKLNYLFTISFFLLSFFLFLFSYELTLCCYLFFIFVSPLFLISAKSSLADAEASKSGRNQESLSICGHPVYQSCFLVVVISLPKKNKLLYTAFPPYTVPIYF